MSSVDTRTLYGQLKDTVDLISGYLDSAKRLAESGQDGEAMLQLNQLKDLYLEFGQRLQALSRPFKSLDDRVTRRETELLQTVKTGLLVGVGVSILFATALVVYFNVGTASRLKVLMENIKRFKSGEPLTPALSGNDEVADLDSTFHAMAAVIDEQNLKLKKSEAELRAVLDGMPVGVVVLDDDLCISFANPRAIKLLSGSGAGSGLVAPVSRDLLSVLVGKGEQPLKKEDFTSEALAADDQLFLKSDSGELIPVDVTLDEYDGPAGNLLLATLVDVSERYRLEQAKREFVQMVSHDLRTPLTSIRLGLELFQEGVFGEINEKGHETLRMSDESCGRLIHLVNDLLDIDKLQSGKFDLILRRWQVSRLFEQAIAGVEHFAARHEVSIAPGAIEVRDVYGDGDRLVQVLVNLISNAVKFSPGGSVVMLSAKAHDGFCRMEVTDRGRGIPADKIDAIFNRFSQVKAEDGQSGKGTGLGLSICRALVEAHGGAMGVVSEVGVGSTFWFDLPLETKDVST